MSVIIGHAKWNCCRPIAIACCLLNRRFARHHHDSRNGEREPDCRRHAEEDLESATGSAATAGRIGVWDTCGPDQRDGRGQPDNGEAPCHETCSHTPSAPPRIRSHSSQRDESRVHNETPRHVSLGIACLLDEGVELNIGELSGRHCPFTVRTGQRRNDQEQSNSRPKESGTSKRAGAWHDNILSDGPIGRSG